MAFRDARIDPSVHPVDPRAVPAVSLASGQVMPLAAFGTFHSDWAQQHMFDATVEAIRIGWRHVDTARAYENEAIIGEAIREAINQGYISSVNDLFITGKLWNGHMKPGDVAPALERTLEALGIDRINLYLSHWPWPNVHVPGCGADHVNPDAVPYIHEDFMRTWREIVALKRAGKIIDIGTSNNTRGIMQLILRDCGPGERPAVNQMEMHPLFQQATLRRYFESEGIVTMAHMALGSPHRPARDTFKEHRSDLEDPTIVAIANDLGTSPAAVCLSWAIQREGGRGGFVSMSTRSRHIKDNLACTTRALLTPEHLERIDAIDANNRLIWGQVFLWPEAAGDWRVLWDDSQLFETRKAFQVFQDAWRAFVKVKRETTCQVE